MSAPFVFAGAAGPPEASRSGWSLLELGGTGVMGPPQAESPATSSSSSAKVLLPLGPSCWSSCSQRRWGARRSARGGYKFTEPKKKKTYNIADSHVVTHRSTSATQSSLTTEFGMESGSFCLIWS